jgi:flagellar hook-associated protein 2
MAGSFQIGGLVSGLDTAKIIEQLMSVEQRPLKLLETQQQKVKDRKAAYSELSSKLSALRSKTIKLLLSSTNQARAATSSNTSVATASAAPATAIQSFTVDVLQLATKSSLTSTTSIGQPVDPTVPLDQAGFGTTPTSGTFSINGTNVTVNAAVDTLNDVVNNINATIPGVTASIVGNQMELVSNAGPITIGVIGNTSNFLSVSKLAASSSVEAPVGTWTNTSTGGMGAAQSTQPLWASRFNTGLVSATGTFTINGVSFDWNADSTDAIADDTINSIVSRINASAAKVTASYDAATDKFTLVGKDTGPAAIAISDDSGNLLDALGIAGATQSYGKPSQYQINGGPVQSSTSNIVTDAVSGMTLTLKGTGTTTVDVSQDVQTAVNGVKDWVQAYNEALALMRQQLQVDPQTNLPSIFTGNGAIQGIESRLRRVVNVADNTLGTSYTELPRIGISTGPVGSAPGTTTEVILDEAKLTQALTSDPAAVTALLTSATGPINTLNTYLLGVTSYTGPLSSSQSAADRQLREMDGRMRSLQLRLNSRQAALEKKFADLEAAMAKLQAQSAQLSGQLGQAGALGGMK